MAELGLRLAVSFTQIAAVTCIVIVTVLLLTLAERKVLGWMQDRMGPMEVGPYGILQPFADAIKLFSLRRLIEKKTPSMPTSPFANSRKLP